MFEEGDFEVVDECTGDDPEIIEKTEPVKTDNDGTTNGQSAAKVTKGILKMPKVTPDATQTETIPAKGNNIDTMDFTADVSMETENPEDDGVIQIDVTDPIIIDGEEGDEKTEGKTKTEGTEETKEMEVVEILPEHAWYEEKINSKSAIVKERLSKLARVLEFSYPTYQPWLEHYKDSVCELEPPRRCPLTRPHSNRWKFICSRKPVQESTNKEEDSAEGTVNKKVETVWRLGSTDGSGVNTDNASQYPPFVMRVVKVFEEFIQNVELTAEPEPAEAVVEDAVEPEKKTVDEPKAPEAKTEDATKVETTEVKPAEETKAVDSEAASEDKNDEDENIKDETSDEKDTVIDRNHNWLWLLVRSNSKDELMVFATGKKISPATMEKLKETFETGPGKDCNVKSLYCKSIAKLGNSTTTNITFLAGTEALEETVGGLKIQLAPKTNFWCNAAGVEQVGAAVGDLLNPVQKFTVAEIGCGLGLIGLMQAKKCRQVIGLDAPSEIEEAEMTSELNKITNSSFVMGQPSEMMAQITKLLKNTRSAAIVNTNTKIGRTIEMMTALRKIPSLRRVVMITTLTKQSVRAILELTRPADGDLGNPFMPVRAVLVDTLPVGPHFEVVIRMERLTMHKMSEPWFWNHVQFRAGLTTQTQPQNANSKKSENDEKSKDSSAKGSGNKQSTPGASGNKRSNNRAHRRNKMKRQAQLKAAGQGVVVGSRIVVGPGLVTGVVKNAPQNLVKNPMAGGARGSARNQGRNPQTHIRGGRGKRPHSPDRNNTGTKKFAGNNKSSTKPVAPAKLSPDSPTSQSDKVSKTNNAKVASPLKRNPMARVQGRGSLNSGSQRRRRGWGGDPSRPRGAATGQRRGGRDNNQSRGNDMRSRGREPPMDPVLLRQVQEQQMLLSLAQQKFNNQGPTVDVDTAKQLHNMLNIVLEQTNKLHHQLPRSVWDRIAPPSQNSGFNSPPQNPIERDNMGFRDRFVHDMGQQEMRITTQNNRQFMQSNQQQQQQQGPVPLFPVNRPQLDQIAPAGMSPLEFSRNQGNDRSRGGRDYRKTEPSLDNWHRQNPFVKQTSGSQQTNKLPTLSSQVESNLRGTSPKRSLISPPRMEASNSRRFDASVFPQPAPLRRPNSPVRRQNSPPMRQPSPPRTQTSEIFHRRPAASQGGRQQQQQQQDRQQQQQNQQTTNSSRRGNSPARQRDQIPAARSAQPLKKLGDDWDIMNKNSLDQGNWSNRQQQQQQQRSGDRNAQETRWSNDRPSNTQNWDQSSGNDRFRKNVNQDNTFMGGSGDSWNAQQNAMKSLNKEQWIQGSGMSKQWGSGTGVGSGSSGLSGDNWSSRGKDNFGQQSNNRMDSWRDGKKNDKDDWSDLPEDARDPWGDDGGSSNNKQRWQSAGDRGGSNSNWGRDNNDKMDMQNWSNKSTDNWQNKGSSMNAMSNKLQQWPTMGNQNSNEQRWMSQNDSTNKTMNSGNWSSGNSNSLMNNWRPQNYPQGFSSQRQNMFGSNNFKDGR